jgi:signal transduction histidine kinase
LKGSPPRRLVVRLSVFIGLLLLVEVALLATIQVFTVSGPLGSTSHDFRHEVQETLQSPGIVDPERVVRLKTLFGEQLADVRTMDDLAMFTAPFRRDAQFPSAYLVALSLVVVVLLAGVFSRQLARPVTAVTRAAARVTAGDLSARVEITPRMAQRNDETTQLARNFNAMATTLERLARERRDMIADIAHELRTPLSVLQGTLDALEDGVLPLNHDEVARLSRQTELLARLVEDLRTVSLAESARLQLDLRPTELAGLVEELVESLRVEANERNVRLVFHAGTGVLSPIRIDADRLAQIVLNLLWNAVRHTPAGGLVTVHLVQGESQQIVQLSDTGPGIPEEALPRLFDRFYRADGSRARAYGGSGLGLTIAKLLTELHGGTVTAANRPEGGAVFTVTLPLTEVAAPSRTDSSAPGPESG